MRLLVVEDDLMLGRALKTALLQEHFVVDWVRNGEVAVETLRTTPYDAVILDINLPKRNGLKLLADMCLQFDATPLLIVTARDAGWRKVEGLDAGADDYLVKPFDLDELLARLRAIIRRAHGRANPLITHGDIVLDPRSKTVTRAGELLGARLGLRNRAPDAGLDAGAHFAV